MNEKLIIRAVNEYCSNPTWKEYYEKAPSNNCKRYISLEFYYSNNADNMTDYVEYKDEKSKLQETFTYEDWKYLFDNCANNPIKSFYQKKWGPVEIPTQ